ncbi:hypothetical protein PTSG_00083 [Salpingoeca rosetta]|uniref:alpha-amylase n=1 Tax=Salpingoeca rosetta (strain ATCC 50818 / BSB-021) TaxID=946362 RepID=F2TVG8_SALR5|nr:uncharacterized protein PTSG_00083 [Salpingoeca rosetta]EGD72064.1 hypothetical protein PTSG_00083 [Salpingoeca rosetta]|eukprot:XP_004998636.1 hypothetical protein PTSG_00083 [Salpingoeca rosetta]
MAILTDRFAQSSSGSTAPCNNLQSYCGGTWNGTARMAQYIKQLGANALWISPIPENTDNGYHGYWQKNIYNLNPNYGTGDQLTQMINQLQQMDIWVMLDVVINHMGNQDNGKLNDFSMFYPFNDSSHYHSYCQIQDWTDMHQIQYCRLANLPDLAQENSFVATTLQNWVLDVINRYNIDGLRFDTVLEVPVDIWKAYAAPIKQYTVGEVDNGDPALNAQFQGALDATLNYPMYWTLRHVFQEGQSASMIHDSLQQQRSTFTDISVLALFLDNHDNPRFLNIRNDYCALRNALAYILFAEGIPIIYYGTEQGFAGGNDPANREDLWRSNYDTSAPVFQFIATLTAARTKLPASFYSSQQYEKYVLDNLYVFTRGPVLVATTNGGCGAQTGASVPNLPYSDGASLCNVLNSSDCIQVQGGTANIAISDGNPKVYLPTQSHFFLANATQPLYYTLAHNHDHGTRPSTRML